MERWVGKVAVVTGASSGIGAAIVKDLVKAGLIVIGLARRTNKVDELKKELMSEIGELHTRFCDVSDVSSIKEAFAWIEEAFGVVHIIVNNAGIAVKAMILSEEDSIDLMADVINTNLLGMVACTQEAFRIMKKNKIDAGHIVNINSVAGHKIPIIPNHKFNVYPSTKYGVTALTEVIRQELNSLENKNIRITSISPGVVKTEIIQKGTPEENALLANMPGLEAEDVSNSVMHAIGAPAHVQIHEIIIKPVGELL